MFFRNLVTALVLFVLAAPALAFEDFSPQYSGTNIPVYGYSRGYSGGNYGGGYGGGYFGTGPSMREMRRRENEDRSHGQLDWQVQQLRVELNRPNLSPERRARLERKLDQLLGVDSSSTPSSPPVLNEDGQKLYERWKKYHRKQGERPK